MIRPKPKANQALRAETKARIRTVETRVNATETEFRQEQRMFSDEQLEQFIAQGMVSITPAFSERLAGKLRWECRKLIHAPLPIKKPIDVPGSEQAEKTTLFRKPEGLQWLHADRWSPLLATFSDTCDQVIHWLGKDLFDYAHRNFGPDSNSDDRMQGVRIITAGAILKGQEANRIVVNRMAGKPDAVAILGLHTDPPNETGAVAALSLGEGIDLVTGEPIGDNTLTLYACNDVVSLLGIDQYAHGFESTRTRYSVASYTFNESD